jgi:hypothetical protein
MSILWQGARGDSVKVLQKRLRDEGFKPGRLDGFFGPVTKKAVTAFQKKQNLFPDGLAGPQTLRALGVVKAPVQEDLTSEVPEDKKTRQPRAPVFVSYSHEDTKWLKMLIIHLTPLERKGMVERWDDTRIKSGQDWRIEIAKAIESAKVAVLLISAFFMASEFIMNSEVPALLAKAKDHGTVILPVLISPCISEPLSQFQAANPPTRTLVEMDRGARERLWVKVVQRITEVLNQ